MRLPIRIVTESPSQDACISCEHSSAACRPPLRPLRDRSPPTVRPRDGAGRPAPRRPTIRRQRSVGPTADDTRITRDGASAVPRIRSTSDADSATTTTASSGARSNGLRERRSLQGDRREEEAFHPGVKGRLGECERREPRLRALVEQLGRALQERHAVRCRVDGSAQLVVQHERAGFVDHAGVNWRAAQERGKEILEERRATEIVARVVGRELRDGEREDRQRGQPCRRRPGSPCGEPASEPLRDPFEANRREHPQRREDRQKKDEDVDRLVDGGETQERGRPNRSAASRSASAD